MKTSVYSLLVFGSVLYAGAQELDVAPLGILTTSGASTDGYFAVDGVAASSGGIAMSSGDFVVQGEFLPIVRAGSSATSELISNGSFEDILGTFSPTGEGLMTLEAGNISLPGWTITTGEAAWINNTNSFSVKTPYGDNSVDLTGYFGPNSALAQTIRTRPGQIYRLSLSLGSDADFPGAAGPKSVSVCAGSASTVFTFVPTNVTGNAWQTFNLSFQAEAASTEITIFGISPGIYLGLDNVSVVPDDSAVPVSSENLVFNGGFEMVCPWAFVPDALGVMSLPVGSTNIPGWTTVQAELAWVMNGNAFGPGTPYGALFLDLTGYHDAPPYGGITQTIATTSGQSYRVSFSLGADQDKGSYSGPMSVGITVGSISNSVTFTPEGAGNSWSDFMFPFVADSSATVITFIGLKSGGGGYLGLDKIAVTPGGPDNLEIQIAPPSVTSELLQLSFIGQVGQIYTIESAEELLPNSWDILPGTERTGTGDPIRVDLPKPVMRKRFYRVRVGP